MNARTTSLLGTAALVVALAASQNVFAAPALPPLQHNGDAAWVSGGVGADQSAAFKAAAAEYPLSLEFVRHTASGGNEYIADVSVSITDGLGTRVIDTRSRGPFMLARVPGGNYTITVRHDGKTQTRNVSLSANTRTHQMFVWTI